MFAKVPTEYQPRIVDIYPLKGMTLPTSEHFHSFFSQFGPILEVYQWTASKKSNVDHAYMVFKADDAVPALKKYWSKTTSGYWKESCKIVSGVPKAPSELVERLSALPSTSYAETSKRSGDEETTGEQPQAKKQRLVEEPESSESISPADFIPINTPDDASTLQSESHAVMLKREAHSPRISPTPPALAFAKQAAILAARTRKRNHEARVANGHLTEVERLKAELDEIRAENELTKAERDEVAAERDAAVESSQRAQRELQELKDSVKERDQRTDKILRLVTASLQSLHGGSVEAEV